jgi:phospholipid-translocating ATPase
MVASRSPSPTGGTSTGQEKGNGESARGAQPRMNDTDTDTGASQSGNVGAVSLDSNTSAWHSQAPEGGRARLRFSQDDAAGKQGSTGTLVGSTEQTTDGQNLTVDTRLADSTSHAISNSRSPERSQPTSPTGAAPKSTTQMVPRSRNRGMSLRSSLFAKNYQRNQDADDAIIELGEVGSPELENGGRTQAVKDKDDASITISPIVAGSSLSPEVLNLDSLNKGTGSNIISRKRRPWYKPQPTRSLPVERIEAAMERARKFVLRIHDMPPSKDGRHIPLDPSRGRPLTDDRTQKPHINNTIRSSKYNAWNFLPRQLFAQFSKLANFYFLCVSILQMIPGLSTTGTYTTIVPLLFFVSLSMAKEGLEDFRRYKLDKEENNRLANVLHAYGPVDTPKEKEARIDSTVVEEGQQQWVPVKWQNLRVGDVVKLLRDDAIPADIVLLHSSGPNDIACIETMALDGETNLKNKQPSPSTSKLCGTSEGIMTCRAHFVVEDPNLDLYNFEGKVTVDGKTSPLTNNEIVYRGSVATHPKPLA